MGQYLNGEGQYWDWPHEQGSILAQGRTSKIQLQAKLHLSAPGCRVDGTKRRQRDVEKALGLAEVHVVEGVKELGAKLYVNTLTDAIILQEAYVPVSEAGSDQAIAPCIAEPELSRRDVGKGRGGTRSTGEIARIHDITTRIAGINPWLSDQVGTVTTKAAAILVARHQHCKGEAALNLGDAAQFPSADDFVGYRPASLTYGFPKFNISHSPCGAALSPAGGMREHGRT